MTTEPNTNKVATLITGNCETHGEYQGYRPGLDGKAYSGPCPKCLGERKAAQDERKRQEQERAERQRISRAISMADIPPRFKDRSFDSFAAELPGQRQALLITKRYAEHFEDRLAKGGGLIFCGTPGTGKTHLACAIANHILPQGYTVLFRSAMDIIRRIRETYRPGSEHTERELLENYRRPDLLIIDEIGIQYGTEAEKMTLFEVVNGRYSYLRPSILIGNLPREGMELYLGDRIMDRMQEGGGAVIACDWESYRKRSVKNGNSNGGK